jgi:hypothetical protein
MDDFDKALQIFAQSLNLQLVLNEPEPRDYQLTTNDEDC